MQSTTKKPKRTASPSAAAPAVAMLGGDDDELLTDAQVTAMLGLKPNTLAEWRCSRRADQPRFLKVGKLVRYRRRDVREYLDACTVDPTQAAA